MNKRLQEVGYPQRVEEVTSPNLLFAVVFAEIDEFKYVGVPWFEVYCKCTGPLIATLVDVTGSGIERTKHGHDAVRVTIGPCDVGTSSRGQHDMAKKQVEKRL